VSQVGAPVRILALVGLLATLAVAAWSFTAGRTTDAASAEPVDSSVAANPVAAAQAAAAKLSAHNRATAAGHATPATAAKKTPAKAPAAKTAAQAKTKVAAKPAKTATVNGTPTTIAALLRDHRAVVVLLYDPRTQVDAYSLGEAQLGATRAHAGFLRVDVMNQRQAAPFTKAYGVLQDPTLLFFARPGKLVQRLSGFADHDTVAQAALNAALGLGAAPAPQV